MTDREQTPQDPSARTAASGPVSGEGATAVPPTGHDGTTRDGTTRDETRYEEPVRPEPAPDRTAQFAAPQYGTQQYGTPQYGTPQYGAPQYGTRREDTPPLDTPGTATGVQPGAQPGQQPGATTDTVPEYTTRPVAVRRPDTLAGLLLVLAGAAAAISLLLRWVSGNDVTGWGLLRDGFTAFGDGRGFSSGLWQPTAVILGGGVLLVLGLLVLLPARTHRFLGLVALLVTVVTAVAVLIPLAKASWDLSTFDTGIWFAIAVPVLGLLGSLKALTTGPKPGARTQHGA